MRIIHCLAIILLSATVAACSGIETRPGDTAAFAAGNYKYYRWRSEPLPERSGTTDLVYLIDPILRRQVNAGLADKGYVLDPEQAQFSVDYIYASGLRLGERKGQVGGASLPSATVNRQVNQAVVDNTNALGGVKETSNIALQFNDVKRKQQVWQVVITKIVENANEMDRESLRSLLKGGVRQALRPLPVAP